LKRARHFSYAFRFPSPL